jgi:hypothetical protein
MSQLPNNLCRILSPLDDATYYCRCLIANNPIESVRPVIRSLPPFVSFQHFYTNRRNYNLVYYAHVKEVDPDDYFKTLTMTSPQQDRFHCQPYPFEPRSLMADEINTLPPTEPRLNETYNPIPDLGRTVMQAARDYLKSVNICFADKYNTNQRFFVIDEQQLANLSVYVNNRCNWLVGDHLIDFTGRHGGFSWTELGKVWLVIDRFELCPDTLLTHAWMTSDERRSSLDGYQLRKIEYVINRSCPHRLQCTKPNGQVLVEGVDLFLKITDPSIDLPPLPADENWSFEVKLDTNVADAFFVFMSADHSYDPVSPPLEKFLTDYSMEERMHLRDELIAFNDNTLRLMMSSNVSQDFRDTLGVMSQLQGRFSFIARLLTSPDCRLPPPQAHALLIWSACNLATIYHDPTHTCLSDPSQTQSSLHPTSVLLSPSKKQQSPSPSSVLLPSSNKKKPSNKKQ